MINLILEHLSGKFMNDKGKRMLLVTTLYVLIVRSRGESIDLETLNRELGLARDINGINIGTIVYGTIWGCRFEEFCKTAPLDKIFRYVTMRLPHWLNYRESTQYSLDDDLGKLKSILAK